MNIEEYNKNPNRCSRCGTILSFETRKRKYCSKDCLNKSFSEIMANRALENYNKNPPICDFCGKNISFERRNDKKKKYKSKFCDKFCSSRYQKIHNPLSESSKQRMREKQKLIQPKIWTDDYRKQHSLLMKQIVRKHPDSYSRNNVCGRVKSYETIDSYGNTTKCLGKWELLVVDFLNKNSIKWTNKIDETFEYFWNGSVHQYFPDFKLPENDIYIEVKGFERERDKAKWSQFPKKLIIIKKTEIKKIKNGTYSLC
jgi:RNA polymerase-binding transcription factor DksA